MHLKAVRLEITKTNILFPPKPLDYKLPFARHIVDRGTVLMVGTALIFMVGQYYSNALCHPLSLIITVTCIRNTSY